MYIRGLIFIWVLCNIGFAVKSQAPPDRSFAELRKQIGNKEDNRDTALSLARQYIRKSKKEGNTYELLYGWKMAAYFTENVKMKMKYADSCIAAALESRDDYMISAAYITKGTICSFSLRDYKEALDQFEIAEKYAERTKDEYQVCKIHYHIAQMKLYLEYDEQALQDIDRCLSCFERMRSGESNKVLDFNYSKGYFNSLHLASVAYTRLGLFYKADSVIREGINRTGSQSPFSLEKAYFLKSRGIRNFRKMKYSDALEDFREAVPELKKTDDFAWLSVVYFYIGKTLDKSGNTPEAITYYTKVDSIYTKRHFILPELRENFTILISYFRAKKNREKELYYTRQLSKADADLFSGFRYIAPKVLKEWTSGTEPGRRKGIFSGTLVWYGLIVICGVTALCLVSVFLRIRSKKDRLPKITGHFSHTAAAAAGTELNDKITARLEEFEKSKGFLNKGVRLGKLAPRFGTNEKYLSEIIHRNKAMSFQKYLSHLRIRHIIDALDNGKFLNYTVQGLAEECGIASRQNFSKLFKEYTGMRPTDYIAEKKKEIEKRQL